MWTERHRPGRLSEIVGQERTKQRLTALLKKKGEMPHLLLVGPPGSGKTTTALILAREVLGENWRDYTLSLNASDDRGIDVVRERIKTFARYTDVLNVPFRIVLLDEVDEATSAAQTALRRIMEEYSKQTRFVLLANYPSGIIEPIQSRCAILRFERLSNEDVKKQLERIASSEGVGLEEGALDAICSSSGGDMRQAINILQAASSDGRTTLESVESVVGASPAANVSEIIRLALSGKFENAREKMIDLVKVHGVSERDFMKLANDAVNALEPDAVGAATRILGEYDFRMVQGANKEIQLSAMLAELASLKTAVRK